MIWGIGSVLSPRECGAWGVGRRNRVFFGKFLGRSQVLFVRHSFFRFRSTGLFTVFGYGAHECAYEGAVRAIASKQKQQKKHETAIPACARTNDVLSVWPRSKCVLLHCQCVDCGELDSLERLRELVCDQPPCGLFQKPLRRVSSRRRRPPRSSRHYAGRSPCIGGLCTIGKVVRSLAAKDG